MLNIYISNLKKYNEGEIVGEWLELPCTEDEIQDVLNEIGINDEYEEYSISTYETEIKGLEIDEDEDIEELNKKMTQIEQLQEWEQEKLFALLEYNNSLFNDIEQAIKKLDTIYLYSGCHNETDLGQEIVEQDGFGIEIPEALKSFIDYKAIGEYEKCNGSGDFTSYGYIAVGY